MRRLGISTVSTPIPKDQPSAGEVRGHRRSNRLWKDGDVQESHQSTGSLGRKIAVDGDSLPLRSGRELPVVPCRIGVRPLQADQPRPGHTGTPSFYRRLRSQRTQAVVALPRYLHGTDMEPLPRPGRVELRHDLLFGYYVGPPDSSDRPGIREASPAGRQPPRRQPPRHGVPDATSWEDRFVTLVDKAWLQPTPSLPL